MKKLFVILLLTSITSLSYSQTNTIKLENELDKIELPIFVLRYKGTILDVCPLEKDYNGNYGFTTGRTFFKFKNNKITKDELIELVSRYRFELRGDYVIYGKVSYRLLDDDGDDNLPTYLTIKKEIINIK